MRDVDPFGLFPGESSMNISRADAERLDLEDELSQFRDRFVVDDPDLIYMDGNSLGRLPKATQARLKAAVEDEWGKRLIRSWNEGWYEAGLRIGGKLAELIGARADEVAIADATSVNLYKAATAAALARPERNKIVTDSLNFPSDVYILHSVARQLGGKQVVIVESQDGVSVPPELLEAELDDQAGVLALSHTAFKTGYTHDMATVSGMAHQAGAMMIWDMSHSVGAVDAQLDDAGADLAIGCTYKYLNGGPGSPAFLFVRRELQPELVNPISGWFSQDHPFDMSLEYQAAGGMRRFLTSTPPTLSLLAIEPGVDMLREAGMARVRARSVKQTSFFVDLWRERLAPLGFRLQSPAEPSQRGAHISLGHEHALAIDQALIHDARVLPDFRPPDNIRFGMSPLYTTFVEIFDAVERLADIVTNKRFEVYQGRSPEVT
jgi:kynureninase